VFAVFVRLRNIGIESDISLEGEPHDIVELQSQIRELQLCRKQMKAPIVASVVTCQISSKDFAAAVERECTGSGNPL
jgi:hypothetical protein